jgi:hypothetical protein
MCPKQTLAVYHEINILSEIVIFYVAVDLRSKAVNSLHMYLREADERLAIHQSTRDGKESKLLYYTHSCKICRICTLSSYV